MAEIQTSVEVGLGSDIYSVPETTNASESPLGWVGSARVHSGIALGSDHSFAYGLGLGLQRVSGQLDVPNSRISDVYLGNTIPEDPQNCPDTTCYTSQNFNRSGFDVTWFISKQFGSFEIQSDMGSRYHFFDNGHAYLENDLLTQETKGIQHALNSSSSILVRPSFSYHMGALSVVSGVDYSAGIARVTSPTGKKGRTHTSDVQIFAGLSLMLDKSSLKSKSQTAADKAAAESASASAIVDSLDTALGPFTLESSTLEIRKDKIASLEIPFTGSADSLKILLTGDMIASNVPLEHTVSENVLIINLSEAIKEAGEYRLFFTTTAGTSTMILDVLPTPTQNTNQNKPTTPKIDMSGWD